MVVLAAQTVWLGQQPQINTLTPTCVRQETTLITQSVLDIIATLRGRSWVSHKH